MISLSRAQPGGGAAAAGLRRQPDRRTLQEPGRRAALCGAVDAGAAGDPGAGAGRGRGAGKRPRAPAPGRIAATRPRSHAPPRC